MRPSTTIKAHPYLVLSLVCLATYLVGLGLRIWELPLWLQSSYWLDGEPLMATHDAYGWLAGAQGTSYLSNRPMSEILSWLHYLTGIDLGLISFWLPALIAPLAALPICILAAYWRMAKAGLVAGIMSAGSVGYLLRTRLGFGDTDILTLFLPLVFVLSLIWWLSPFIKSAWSWPHKGRSKDHDLASFSDRRFYLGAATAGLVFWGYSWFYPNAYPIAIYVLTTCMFVTCLLNRSVPWQELWAGLAMVLALGKLSWLGLGLSAGIVWLGLSRPHFIRSHYTGLLLLALILALYPLLHGPAVAVKLIEPILNYADIELTKKTAGLLQLPAVQQSIREAQEIDWIRIMNRLAGHWALFIPALLGYLWLIVKRPLSLIMLPLLALALLSFKLGNRFAMYGGPVLGLGLAFLSSQLLSIWSEKRLIYWLGVIALALLVTWPVVNIAAKLRPSPVLPKAYAQTLLELRSSPGKSQLWQWWDYGYAAQYYAQRRSFGDGGSNSRQIYPLAKVHTTASPAKAAKLITFVAAHQRRAWLECQKNGTEPKNPGSSVLYYPIDPLAPLEDMGPKAAQAFVQDLGPSSSLDLPTGPNPQYLVLSWENLHLAYWITYYGNWDLATGSSYHGRLQFLQRKGEFNTQRGTLRLGQRQALLVSLDVIDQAGLHHKDWPNPGETHAILNKLSHELCLMDDTVYNSMLVQMLIGDPKSFEPYFELVEDRFPWNRVYRVR